MRALAKKRREQEVNFEEKKMNLSLQDIENKENNYRSSSVERYENDRVSRNSRGDVDVYIKDPYYDNAYVILFSY